MRVFLSITSILCFWLSFAQDQPKNTDALLKIAIIIHSEGNTTKVENIKTKLKELHPAKADELDEIITCKKDC